MSDYVNESLRVALQAIRDEATKPLHVQIERLRGELAKVEDKLSRWHCVWCEHVTTTTGDAKADCEALRVHSQTCDGNPSVRRVVELQRLLNAKQARVAELENLTEAAGGTWAAIAAANARAEMAEAERDALRADAERYRWLRDAKVADFPDADWWSHVLGDSLGDAFDAAIDAAKEPQT